MKEFKNGKKIKLTSGDEITIKKKIGEGGQGTVYIVDYNNKDYALKWYAKRSLINPAKFYENLKKNAILGSPAKEFLWPLAVTDSQGGSFGYIMELRPKEFEDFAHFLNASARFKSTSAVINASINMVDAFQSLHRKGYSYQDLNDGNFFVHPETGDLLICDNDNVAPYGESLGVGGKSRYMAPEVVLGENKPNLDSDLFSLAVVLFMMIFISHPLEGAKVASCPCLTDTNEKIFYAQEPIFVCDPSNPKNRPVRGIHNNIINLWPLFPDYLKDAFIRSFTDGIKNKSKRLLETEWKKILYKLNDDLIPCRRCGEENFSSLEKNGSLSCCECKNQIDLPLFLRANDFAIPLFPGKNLTQWHTEEGAYSSIIGTVIQNKSNPNLWGLRNLSEKMWLFMSPKNDEKTVKQNDVVPIFNEVSISFGNKKATINK